MARANKIEFTAMSQSLPINSKAMLSRLVELLEENETNCLSNLRDNWSVQATMWLIMTQVFGHGAVIDLSELWQQLYDEYNTKEI